MIYLATVVHDLRKKEDSKAQALRTVAELHKEWNQQEMYEARERAYQFIYNHPCKSLKEPETAERKDPELQYVWVVIGFFERLAALLKNKQITDELFADTFGQIFSWWDEFLFQEKLFDGWASHKRIEMLRSNLASQLKNEQALIARWRKEATEYKHPDENAERVNARPA